jgi:hypothetical protein
MKPAVEHVTNEPDDIIGDTTARNYNAAYQIGYDDGLRPPKDFDSYSTNSIYEMHAYEMGRKDGEGDREAASQERYRCVALIMKDGVRRNPVKILYIEP